MIMKGLGRLAVGLLLLVSQTGCWDMKTIQDTNYITAMGFDYQKGHYMVYCQMLDFSNVAKQEGSKGGQPPAIWVGQEEGETVNAALARLYKTIQQRALWGHVGAYVFTREALKQGVGKFTDSSVRYGETRFTPWVYSTDEPIETIFSVIPFFNVSPLASILMQPEENYLQRAYIRPLKLYRFAALTREPGYTVMMPTLAIRKDVWVKNEKPDPKLEVSGVYTIAKKNQVEWLSEDQFKGARWLENSTVRTPMVVYINGKAKQSVIIKKPKARITSRMNGDQPLFDIHIEAKAVVAELLENIDEDTLKRQIAKQISEEIEQTFKAGKSRDTDIYQLEHVLYKQAFPEWSKLTINGEKPLENYQLGDIKVDIQLSHSGMLKMRENEQQY
ncbi:Ger(x)C family spore germination protein [Paenibacillus frigoriresistens]|uniref:Ger(x)C family spore germination protein n=1 Tax=Paenibacillus alginolyticus TaxID=59839 RepID=UPI0015645F05|nr:Ger(x)C family spore germination protein [Paenibacillus frigoriresistens]NRF91005.1 Ger(x)C family spore germination protein [Paenibacillus frigoriresistens]